MSTLEWIQNLHLNEINLAHTYVATDADYPMKNGGRAHCGMLYTIEGEETYIFSDGPIVASPNTVLFIPKNEKYTIELSGKRSVVVGIDFEAKGFECARPLLSRFGASNPLRSVFADAERCWLKKTPEYYTECCSYVYRILAAVIKNESNYQSSAIYARISDAVTYLHSHYLEPDFRIENLLGMVDMSSRYFEMLFSKRFKMTPKEYVLHLKLELAKELLQSEKNTVTGIAAKLGFGDVYHFSKTFKAKTGYSPTKFKEK